MSFKYLFSYAEKIFDYEQLSEDIELSSELKAIVKTITIQINYLYEKAMLEINQYIIEKTVMINEKSDKSQAVQYSTFSIFTTVIAFVLTNVFTIVNNLTFSTIVICNLSILLFSSLQFSFIGFFFNLPYSSEKKVIKIFKYIFLIVFPVLVLISILVVCNKLGIK